MKMQTCRYQQKKGDPWKIGVAVVKSFGVSDIDYIIGEDGKRLPNGWDYKLVEGPMQYLDTDY